ncbi:MAG: TIGR04141 family sporadically distributed protein [Bdellovibrio sp.]|nr:TIGR04141 family sporadically distributed protein [Bdellovibrio sp.]
MTKKINLSIYLSKLGIAPNDCVDGEAVADTHAARIELSLKDAPASFAYIGITPAKEPKWMNLVKLNTDKSGKDKLAEMNTSTVSISCMIVIHLKSKMRSFIFCFGHGKKFLKYESVEKNFGRNLVLNTADESKISTIRTKSFESQPLFKELQSLLTTDLYEFGFNCDYELLQKVVGSAEGKLPNTFFEKHGKGQKELLSYKFSGYEAVNINVDIEHLGWSKLCNWLLEKYSERTYKKLIPNIDFFDFIKEESIIKSRNDELIALIRANQLDDIALCIPEKIENDDITGFEIKGTKYTKDSQLERLILDDITEALREVGKLGAIDIDDLKRWKVNAFAGDDFRGTWSIFRCLTIELLKPDGRYVLSDGEWYRLDKNHFTKTVKDLNTRVQINPFPSFSISVHKDEAGYNKAVSAQFGHYLFDRKLQASSLGQEIEPCDVLCYLKDFLHIKRSKSSQSLSHLFNQGVVSNELIVRGDTIFTTNIVSSVDKKDQKNISEIIEKKRHEVSFAIIVENRKQIDLSKKIENLPAFSIISLSKTVEIIERGGKKVKIYLIPTGTAPKQKVKIIKKKA